MHSTYMYVCMCVLHVALWIAYSRAAQLTKPQKAILFKKKTAACHRGGPSPPPQWVLY